jgi:probable addiction module antidote protein
MTKTVTTRYDVAEHLRTPEEMAAYLEACLEEADGDAAFIAKALGDIARAKVCTRRFPVSVARASTPSLKSSVRLG